MSELTGSEFVQVAAAKFVDPRPAALRYVARDGERILQIAQSWVQGYKSGIEWVDVPTVGEKTGDQP